MMSDSVFEKTMRNVRKPRAFKLVTTKRRRDYSVSEPGYHTTKLFRKNLLAIEIKKNRNTY